MRKTTVGWVLIIIALVFVGLDAVHGMLGLTQFLLPTALAALGITFVGGKRSETPSLVLAIVAAVLAAIVIVRRLSI